MDVRRRRPVRPDARRRPRGDGAARRPCGAARRIHDGRALRPVRRRHLPAHTALRLPRGTAADAPRDQPPPPAGRPAPHVPPQRPRRQCAGSLARAPHTLRRRPRRKPRAGRRERRDTRHAAADSPTGRGRGTPVRSRLRGRRHVLRRTHPPRMARVCLGHHCRRLKACCGASLAPAPQRRSPRRLWLTPRVGCGGCPGTGRSGRRAPSPAEAAPTCPRRRSGWCRSAP